MYIHTSSLQPFIALKLVCPCTLKWLNIWMQPNRVSTYVKDQVCTSKCMYTHTHTHKQIHMCTNTRKEETESNLLSRSKLEWILPGHGSQRCSHSSFISTCYSSISSLLTLGCSRVLRCGNFPVACLSPLSHDFPFILNDAPGLVWCLEAAHSAGLAEMLFPLAVTRQAFAVLAEFRT